MKDFSKWGAESLGESLSFLEKNALNRQHLGVPLTEGSEDESTPKQKTRYINLKKNRDGYPMLPSLEEINRGDLLYKKMLVGKFIGDMYGL